MTREEYSLALQFVMVGYDPHAKIFDDLASLDRLSRAVGFSELEGRHRGNIVGIVESLYNDVCQTMLAERVAQTNE